MDILLIGSLVSLGVWMNSKGIQRDLGSRNISDVPASEIPSGSTPYGPYKSVDVWNIEQSAGKKIYDSSFRTKESNIVFEGPPDPMQSYKQRKTFQKVDLKNKLPVEYMSTKPYTKDTYVPSKKSNTNYGYPNTGGTYGINLLGIPITPENFKFGNMMPFFGSTVRQNVDDLANQQTLETFSGNSYVAAKKREIGRFFPVQTNVTNVYGRQNLDDYELERYYVSDKRNNEAPIEKVNVGPGLNAGYTSLPSGGVQQADTLEYVRPKTTNELRVLTKPKLSYYSRVVGGQKISRPGKVGELFKNRPDTFFIQTPDRYMTTTGLVTGPTLRPKQVLRYTNRKTTSKYTYQGPSGTTTGSVEAVRPTILPPRRVMLKQKQILIPNATTDGQGCADDFGKKSYNVPFNTRQLTSVNKYAGPPVNARNTSGAYVANRQPLRQTKKMNVVGNVRPEGTMAPQQPGKGVVWDPNDVARTTIKETNIHNNNNGYMAPQQPGKGVVWDPNDVARTTIKETNIHNNNNGYMAPQQPGKGVVWDPNQVARTTIKEQMVDNNHLGVMAGNNKLPAYDPEDKARETIRQTTMISDYVNPANAADQNSSGQGYVREVETLVAPTTHRETTSTEYQGVAQGEDQGGYQIANMEDKNTNRQFTSNHEYSGIAGPRGDVSAPMSHEEYENSTIRSLRQEVSQGRTPASNGPLNGVTSEQIHATTRKLAELQSQQLAERPVVPNAVVNSIAQIEPWQVSKDKMTVPNVPLENRLDPVMVEAFQKNPYTQSLHSFVFP
jgi:Family of unknown function (DUF5899)